jgi:hypothetical protein
LSRQSDCCFLRNTVAALAFATLSFGACAHAARVQNTWARATHFYFNRRIFMMQRTTATGSCNPSRYPYQTTRVALDRPELSDSAKEITRLKTELARVNRELKELKFATQQFVRSCI